MSSFVLSSLQRLVTDLIPWFANMKERARLKLSTRFILLLISREYLRGRRCCKALRVNGELASCREIKLVGLSMVGGVLQLPGNILQHLVIIFLRLKDLANLSVQQILFGVELSHSRMTSTT
jgi:hypothetical protein